MEGGLSKRILVFWETAAILIGGIVGGLAAWLIPTRTWYWYLTLWVVGFLLVACCFLWLPLLYESSHYRITPEYVEYESGVCVFVRTRMLRRSIMYVTLVRSPVSPFLGTRSLVISSMGGNLVIPGLPRETAEEILKDVTPRYPAIRSRIFSSEKGERR